MPIIREREMAIHAGRLRLVSETGSSIDGIEGETIAAYLRFLERLHGLSPALRAGYREDLDWFRMFCICEGIKPLVADSLACRHFLQSERFRGLAPARLERLKVNVEAFYRWAERTYRVSGNPMTAIRQEERRLRLVGTLPRIEAQREEEHHPALVCGR